MEIKRGNTIVCDVYLKDNSYTVEEIMGEHTLTLNFLSRNVIDLQINDYVDFEGNIYKIRHNEKVTKRETSLGYEYNVTLYSSRYDLQDVQFFLHGVPERKKNFDYYTGTARDWLNLLVKNMNRTGTGWQGGSCIESRMITLSFKDKTAGAVLDELIKELDTEYWISGKTISIGKRKYSSNGLTLGQGEGMGFNELEVSAVDDTPPITVLYPYGSDKNLGSDYGSDYLLLPGGILSLEKNVDKYGRIEQSVQFDHIFPKGEFTVTEKIDTLTLKCDIDFNLRDCLIDDVDVIVTFQNGGLAGYDLAIVKESVDDKIKQFKLIENKQENALTVPGDINFSVGDKFILTGLKMPQSYIDKAAKQLQEEAQAYLDSKCEKRVQLKGKCDQGLFRQLNLFIAPGQMVGVYSEQLKIDREIRVTKVKRFIENDNKPCYRYELTLSDFLESNGFKDMVDDVDKVPDEIEDKVKPVREWTKRSWRDVMETLKMMFDPEGDYFTDIIKPLAVHTAQLIVGTNSQQMDLVGVKFIPNADNDPNYFKNTAGKLVHFTVSETVREWSIPAASFRLNNSLAYYVYAKCPKEGNTGSILVSERQIKLEAEAGYYHFWIGVLNTPEENVRSWNPNYGFTEIAGQTITTGVIKDKLASLVIDLVNRKITATNGATIEGAIKLLSGSSGLSQLEEWAGVSKTISNTVDAANKAQDAANNAQSSANSAVSRLTTWASDSYISPTEKTALIQQKNEVMAEYQEISNQATLYNLTNTSNWSNYYSAYISAITVFDKYTASTPENIYVSYDYMSISQYYTSRKYILNDIAKAAKKAVDDLASNYGDLDYLKEAIANETAVIGGLLLTSMLKLGVKNGSVWTERAGINGTAKNDNDVIAWFGGTLSQAIDNLASIVFRLNGAGQVGGGAIKWYKENGIWNAEYEGIIKAKGIQLPFINVENSDAIYSNGEYRLNGHLSVTTVMDRIILPTDVKYNGSIVSIFNNAWPPFTKTFTGTHVRTQNGQKIFVPRTFTELASDSDFVSNLCVSTGVARLIAVLGKAENSSTQCIRWVVL